MHRSQKKVRQNAGFSLPRLLLLPTLFLALAGGIFLTPSLLAPAGAQESASLDSARQISDNALAQIAAFYEEKASRTSTQRKIDSQLLAEVRMNHGEMVARGVQTIETGIELDSQGKTLVDIDATVTDKLLERIRQMDGEVVNSFPQFRAIRARLPLNQMESLAALPEIKFINRAVGATTSSSATRRVEKSAATLFNHQADFSSRAANVRAQLPEALNNLSPASQPASQEDSRIATGNVTSQGDVTHRAAAARTAFNVTGAGVKIGVMSDSVDGLANAQATGNLGTVTVLPGQSGVPASGEGTAMLEIVHDLAPGAQLYYATGFSGAASMAQNILNLRAAGCDIIIDDVGYFNESPFQDGIIAQAVNTVTAQGALFFSSASNSGNLNDGQSGVWEGDFVDGGPFSFPQGNPLGNIHIFPGGNNNNLAVTGGSSYDVNLFWADPLGASANDYDVFVFNNAGTAVTASSTNTQSGTQDPYEFVSALNVGDRIVVIKYSGAARFIHLDTGRGRLAIATSGQTRGHSAAVNALSVAAVSIATSFPNAFVGGATNPVENFSSDGPRRVFFNANGTAITPGNFSSTGGTVRQKPDIAAADGVVTSLPAGGGLNPFFGTSAAAPHAGAIAGLIKSYNPTLTAPQIRALLISTALDIEAAGVDRDSGAGIVMAYQALQALAKKTPFDYDGDGKTDVSVFRPNGGGWYILRSSTNTFTGQQFGISTDKIVPGDYDGDSKTDLAVYRNGQWYMQRSTAGFTGVSFGQAGDVPVPGDYDGDRKTDVAVFRPTGAIWYILQSSNGTLRAQQFGISTDKVAPGDYDGDSKTDLGVFRNGQWYLQRSTLGFTGIAFGQAGDRPVPGDYDGDGKTDCAVFRNGAWYLLRSQLGFTGVAFGQAGDVPVAGDYDGDGKFDVAVFRGAGQWYMQRSQLGFTGTQFGTTGDVPTPSAFVP